MGSNRTNHITATRRSGATTRIFLRDHRSMNTPVNGPRIENGSETTSVAIAKLRIVFCSSGLNTIEETSTAWNSPSPDCVISRIVNSRRKSSLRRASRAR